jgi:hypothetical protein
MSPALENQETLGQPSIKEKHESAADKRQDPELTVVIEDLLEQMVGSTEFVMSSPF